MNPYSSRIPRIFPLVILVALSITCIGSGDNGGESSPAAEKQESQSTAEDVIEPTEPDKMITSVPEPLDAESDLKFGYTEEERKAIFLELVRAEDKANNEAEFLFPTPDPLSDSYDQQAMQEALQSQAEHYNEFAPIYRGEVAQSFGLTIDQLDDIGVEGAVNQWPFPPSPTPMSG